jgi:ribosomal small subunit protein bTHX
MGRGDRKTTKGKIAIRSRGNVRPRNAGKAAPAKKAPVKAPAKAPVAKKAPAKKAPAKKAV